MDVEHAPDVQQMAENIIEHLSYSHINQFRIICMRSRNCTARAYARIWNLPDIWQKALDLRPFYLIDVLSEHFDRLPQEEKEKVIIHELLHIPKTFSGALMPHTHSSGKRINDRTVSQLHKKYKESLSSKKETNFQAD